MSLRIVFLGTPSFAAEHLSCLLEDQHHTLVGVYTQPDRRSGRGQKTTPSPVKQLAQQHNIPVYQPVTLKTEHAQQQLASLKPDICVVVAYGLILPKTILTVPRLGCLNVHASLLPRWRGAAPIQRAIEAGDAKTGITIMQMDEGLDTGDMLYQTETPITPETTTATLHDRLIELGQNALLHSLHALRSITAIPQPNDLATYAHKLHKQEGAINWQQPAHIVERKIRAFNPWPVAYTHSENTRIRIWQAEVIQQKGPAGHILAIDAHGIIVGCGENALKITRLQKAGGTIISAQDWVNQGSQWLRVGMVLHTP